ncbi:Gfo/Idh/MocA family oxidoreductase, partial [Akkermansiaceae bacterium]|nr:Gfo/Idh/MocA family oxidoreductase [Akkermansiaceae bacterium]
PAIVRGQNLNSRLQIGAIGVGGKGQSDTINTAKCGGKIIGLCDVDKNKLAPMSKKFPDARNFSDFREMLTQMGDQIDGVTISTPDHVHGVAGIMAMQMGKHIYCQKPLTQTVWESRMMRNLAREKKLATQMGNQGSAENGLRRSVELIQSGVIGKPLELHVWTNRPVWPQGLQRPDKTDPVPDSLNWDCWIGPAKMRPYVNGLYHDFKWRGWNEFGTGALGDMACHTVNMPFRALKLGYPTKIECEMSSRVYDETYPLTSRVRFEFPEREGLPPLKFWWYEGNPGNTLAPIRPYPDLVSDIVNLRDGKLPGSGALIIGEKGQLFSQDDYGRSFFVKLNGEKEFTQGDKHEACQGVPQTIDRSPGHHEEWIEMMKGGKPAYSNFEIAAYLNEVILLGTIAQQIGEGQPIDWDGPNMKSTNSELASRLVKRDYREGWAPKV